MADTPDAPDDGVAAPPETGTEPAPPSEDFKSEESKQRVLSDLKREREQRQQLEARIREFEDRDKSDSEKLTDRLTAAEQRAMQAEQEAARLQVAYAKGLTPAQAKRLVGSTVEELEADADEILAAFAPPAADEPAPTPKRRPSELVPGAVPSAEPEPDYDAIADRVRRW
jgi:Spy/CpxP family protein refolding chaperone